MLYQPIFALLVQFTATRVTPQIPLLYAFLKGPDKYAALQNPSWRLRYPPAEVPWPCNFSDVLENGELRIENPLCAL